MTNTKPVLTGDIYVARRFAGADNSGSIDFGQYQTSREENYHMADQTTAQPPAGKTWAQVYHDEVDALVAGGMKNADAVREVANKYGKKENAVRGGIHQYRTRHVNGDAPATTTNRRRRATAPMTADDLIAQARTSLEEALVALEREPEAAKREVERLEAELQAARTRYDELVASVKARKADIEKKLKAVS